MLAPQNQNSHQVNVEGKSPRRFPLTGRAKKTTGGKVTHMVEEVEALSVQSRCSAAFSLAEWVDVCQSARR